MNFREHSGLYGRHAFLSPSTYHWVNYNDQKLHARFIAAMAAKRGVELHQFAHMAIRLNQKMPRSRKTIHMYVNDAIGYKMVVEQPLYFSDNCFGHADTMSFRNMFLRIHDLKTGITPTSERQLEIYAALFCLEYGYSPYEIAIELRIYQRDEVRVFEPTGEMIAYIMDKIIDFDQQIELFKEGESW